LAKSVALETLHFFRYLPLVIALTLPHLSEEKRRGGRRGFGEKKKRKRGGEGGEKRERRRWRGMKCPCFLQQKTARFIPRLLSG